MVTVVNEPPVESTWPLSVAEVAWTEVAVKLVNVAKAALDDVQWQSWTNDATTAQSARRLNGLNHSADLKRLGFAIAARPALPFLSVFGIPFRYVFPGESRAPIRK